jgi:hypothetical protein
LQVQKDFEDSGMKTSLLATIGIYVIIVVCLLSGCCALLLLYDLLGFWAIFLGILLYPVTIFLVPLYVLFVYVDWQLLAFTYGDFLLGCFLFSIGKDDSE